LLEAGAGMGADYTDREYSEAGAEITSNTKKVFSCPIILQVDPPTEEEIDMMNPKTLLVSAIQLKTRKKSNREHPQKNRLTALAFEYIKGSGGSYPIVKSVSEIAGAASIMIASELLGNHQSGKGLLLGNITGVAPTEVVILGAGTVAEYAAKTALGLGANVK